jgi:ribosome small subunit-dependent GTPase A
MQDGKALQAGTSHFLGQNFAKAFDVKFLTEDNNQEFVWATSWGVSTRLIGGLIMTHSDDEGLVLPPNLAPIQVVIIPIPKPSPEIDEVVHKIMKNLKAKGITVQYDQDMKNRPGFKFAEHEMKGIPVRLAIGQRDLEKNEIEVARRDTREKFTANLDGIEETVAQLLLDIQENLFQRAKSFRSQKTTKVDTFDDATLDEQLYLQHIYQEIGYQCLRVSAVENKGIEELKQLMIGKVSMFSGHSGVGKSTLVNAMEPSLDLKTKNISEQSKQGQHTTTFAEMFDLSFDAKIIDTPGIKGFGIVDLEKEDISGYFPEFFKLKEQCKFNNCLHKDEPNCAVKKALENDQISWSRYKNYLHILEGDDENYRTDVYNEDRIISDQSRKS